MDTGACPVCGKPIAPEVGMAFEGDAAIHQQCRAAEETASPLGALAHDEPEAPPANGAGEPATGR